MPMNAVEAAAAPKVSTTAASDSEKSIATIVLAFATDPMARWSFPDPAVYLAYFPAVARAFGGNAFAHGAAHHSAEFIGAALWLPPDAHPDEATLFAIMQEAGRPERQAEAAAVFEQMAAYHPKEPHWYLPLIGVDPAFQGRGHGSALLAHALAECDRQHVAAYLESSNPANIPLYERHGFVRLGVIQEGSSPVLTPMLRVAR
jgi:ribosomal protein S18 acetylase RimI-like enzyme